MAFTEQLFLPVDPNTEFPLSQQSEEGSSSSSLYGEKTEIQDDYA